MHKSKIPSFSSTSMPRFYFVLLLLIIILLVYWYFSSDLNSKQVFANISRLPQSSLFTYPNVSSQIHFNESQGILYVPPHDQPAHFVSMKSNAVRGNHRHKNNENSISYEVLVLLQGQYQFRISNDDTNKYEDYQYDISKIGIVALKFPADKCHALKNIGKQTNWFASYYIKSKDVTTISVDKQNCKKMILT
ncbi:unnamed protein product [Rotaria sordida]|uniref:Uncharacterized protein n=1 Tax=Rotaria sordida TaxID=392033 RepID=A0A814KEJ2_9BILA|nr:unnamed protein product [Rotaria sordida]CAF0916625.1 unnamed protein product [Rotaria sordida]CAF1051422.1 unnamed protein product [Rotaria sordida]CAF3544797.1 unnamed protein product [Rotaria sordida]CAF3571363.1 unnamed protein product [Rotaria sordida]